MLEGWLPDVTEIFDDEPALKTELDRLRANAVVSDKLAQAPASFRMGQASPFGQAVLNTLGAARLVVPHIDRILAAKKRA